MTWKGKRNYYEDDELLDDFVGWIDNKSRESVTFLSLDCVRDLFQRNCITIY